MTVRVRSASVRIGSPFVVDIQGAFHDRRRRVEGGMYQGNAERERSLFLIMRILNALRAGLKK